MFAAIDTAARRIWLVMPYASSFGNGAVTRYARSATDIASCQTFTSRYEPIPTTYYSLLTASSSPCELEALVERRIAAHRRRHQEPIALGKDALHVVAVDMRVADRHVVLLAGVDHARHPLEHFRVLVLARIAELLREVALADQDRAD